MKNKITIIFVLLAIITVNAQITSPSLSPRINVEQNLGLATISLDYGRPSRNNRDIFGALIPYNRVWRTGANASTKITLDREIYLAENKIKTGTYGLYTIPNKNEWTIIIHKNAKLWGSAGYKVEDELVRFKVPVINLNDIRETLTINFEGFNANGGKLIIAWEKVKVEIPVFVDTDAIIFAEIEEKIINSKDEIKAQTYFDAALFYYNKNKDFKKAIQWFDKAIELKPSAFWYRYYRAEIAYTLKDKKTAKTYAEKVLNDAKNSTSSDYGYIAKATLLLNKINAM